MSLNKLNELHPWLRERIEWIQHEIEAWGGTVRYVSAGRSLDKQRELWESRQGWLGRLTGRPVAPPGCSQHNYDPSMAVDIQVIPAHGEAGIDVRNWDDFVKRLGNYVGLVTVEGDPGHFQMYPGSEFGPWAVQSGYCQPGQRYHTQALTLQCGLYGCESLEGDRYFDRYTGE